MFQVSAEMFHKNYVYNTTGKEKKLRPRIDDKGEKLGAQSILDEKIKGKCKTKNPTKQQIKKYKRHGSKLIDNKKFVYTHENILMPIIRSCRVSTPEAIEFRYKLRFKQHDIVLSKELSVISETPKRWKSWKIGLEIRKSLKIYLIFRWIQILKYYDKIKSHVRCLDSLNINSVSYSALLLQIIMGKLPPQKLVVKSNLRCELWGLAELLNYTQ